MSENKIPQSEITRVKGLGFLWDKRTTDRFNGRVITATERSRRRSAR